jgi:predicted nucleic acid-binding protein
LKYLLDTNVLKELSRPTPHENVEAWLSKVDDIDLAVSVISVREISKGIEKKRASDEGLANRLAESAKRIFAAYDDRIISIDGRIAVV